MLRVVRGLPVGSRGRKWSQLTYISIYHSAQTLRALDPCVHLVLAPTCYPNRHAFKYIFGYNVRPSRQTTRNIPSRVREACTPECTLFIFGSTLHHLVNNTCLSPQIISCDSQSYVVRATTAPKQTEQQTSSVQLWLLWGGRMQVSYLPKPHKVFVEINIILHATGPLFCR